MKKSIYRMAVVFFGLSLMFVSNIGFGSERDDRIMSSAKESYVFKTYLQDGDVQIQSTDGLVTLSGTVTEESHKLLAQETAANLPEVKSVNNNLELRNGSPAEMSDTWITLQVKSALLFHRNVSAMTEVSTEDGIVTLKGTAENQAQKELTAEYAGEIEGVRKVLNEMTVANTTDTPAENRSGEQTVAEKIDDASITALAKTKLIYHRSTSGLNTNVVTSDGVVTLSGVAQNEAEKNLATKFVSEVRGVKQVINNMTVK